MKKIVARKKFRKRVRDTARFVLRLKKRPRGKAFAKGNTHGHRFPKGVSGNPGGRPKYKKLSEAFRALLAAKVSDPIKTESYAERIALRLLKLAERGNISAAREAGDRSEGRPAVSISVEQTNPIDILISEMRKESKRRGKPEGFIEPQDAETEETADVE